MKWLKRILVSVLLVVTVLAVLGLLLPDRVHVERSITIDATPEQIYPLVSDLREFNSWSPWFKRDPAMEQDFSGPDSGPGAVMTWRSDHPQVGSGSQRIVEAVPPGFVRTELDFGAMGTASASFTIRALGQEKSMITWGLDTEFGMDLVGRYFGLMFDKWVGADYEAGLADLKSLVENS